MNIWQKCLFHLRKYWWLLLIVFAISAFMTYDLISPQVLWGIVIFLALIFFVPFALGLFASPFLLVYYLWGHFQESKGQSLEKRYIFIPAAMLATFGFIVAQLILLIWVFISSFFIWANITGFSLILIAVFLSGLAPLAILTAPFAVWYQEGSAVFFQVVIFFLTTFFWFGFSRIAFVEYAESFFCYFPHIFLLGALSFQVIALPLYTFNLIGVGNFISDVGGAIFLLFAFIAAFKWRTIKKKLSKEERENLYQPSIWIYIFGFILTNLLYFEFDGKFGVPTATVSWLNIFFLVALIGRFLNELFETFRRKEEQR